MDEIAVRFAGANMTLVAGWGDITEDLPVGSPPTLVRNDGQGALQFTLATYKEGKGPDLHVAAIEEMFVEFFHSHEFGTPENVDRRRGKLFGVSGETTKNSEFVKIWYISNGSSLMLVSYVVGVSDRNLFREELSEAESIVASILF